MPRFLNPYNFVRPLRRPNSPQTRNQQLMWHCPPPPHDRFTGLRGTIHCTMTAQSPVFVSDSECLHEDSQTGHRTYGFFNVEGQDMIPASGLRGAVRSVFEAVTNSRWGVFSDQTMSYREEAGNANRLIPGFLMYHDELDSWYVQLLLGEGGKQNFAAKVPLHILQESGYKHGAVCIAVMQRGKSGVKVEALFASKKLIPSKYKQERYFTSTGVLCVTGENIDNKKHERFFFDKRKTKDWEEPIQLSPDIIQQYNKLICLSREYHADAIAEVNADYEHNKKFALSQYHLSDEQTSRISSNNPILEYGKFPVYVSLDKGEVQYIAPVSIPRVLEKRSFHDILRAEGFEHLLPAKDYEQLSPADRVFGWVAIEDETDETKRDLSKPVAYKGRVRFTSAMVTNQVNFPEDQVSLTILSSPKPTTTRFYVEPREGVPRNVNHRNRQAERSQKYTDRNLRFGKAGNMLRGRKVYRHHLNFNLAEARQRGENNKQNRTIQGIHDAGTTYTFAIHFENLQAVELGALLWTLLLNDGDWQGYHRLGYAKPLGFGSVAINVDNIYLHQANRYDPELADVDIDYADCVGQFIDAMQGLYGATFYQLPNVQDLMALLADPTLDAIYYPRSGERRSSKGEENFRWFGDNKRVNKRPELGGPQLILPYAIDDTEGLPHMRWNKPRVDVDW